MCGAAHRARGGGCARAMQCVVVDNACGNLGRGRDMSDPVRS